MKPKPLPKRFEAKGRSIPFYHNEHYISNGYFLVPKALVKEAHRYCLPCENQPDLERVIPKKVEKTFVKTNRLYEWAEFLVREFVCEDEKAYFNDDYISHFEINSIEGNSPTEIFMTDTGIVLMPMREPEYKKE